jgi:hypothetical protein
MQCQSMPIPGFVAQIPLEATHGEVFSVCVEGAEMSHFSRGCNSSEACFSEGPATVGVS